VPEFPDINTALCRKKLTPKQTLPSIATSLTIPERPTNWFLVKGNSLTLEFHGSGVSSAALIR
jgi:hypothetical protein